MLVLDRGWRVLRLEARTKGPTQKGWPRLALADDAAVREAFNGSACNVGVLLGNGLCDIDLDCDEALAVAGFFLPETRMMFGRASKRMSHRVYMSDVAAHILKAVQTYDDPETSGPHMIELRIGGAKAAQTVFPPSVHPSGEIVAFEPGFDKEPAEIAGSMLIRCVEEAAAAALVARAFPCEGGHKPAQVLGGFLARAGWTSPRVELFARAVMAHVGRQHAKDHIRTARDAAEAHERGGNAFGFPQLVETFGEKRAKSIAKWLHYSEATRASTTGTKTKRTKPAAGSDNDAHDSLIAELAAMPPLRYGRERLSAAKKIDITVGALDKLVSEQRKANDAEGAQPVHWNIEPWHEPVDGAALLDSVADVFSRYAVLPHHAPEALALWVAHAWALDCFQCSPFATLVSPTKRCGKTRVLAILKWLSPRSELAGSISSAAVFRYIQQERPTLLMDEADRTIAENQELQGILNASHKRVGAYVIRCQGDDNHAHRFSTWAPKAIATISKLADTLRDRSIIIETRRKMPNESIEPWNEDGPRSWPCCGASCCAGPKTTQRSCRRRFRRHRPGSTIARPITGARYLRSRTQREAAGPSMHALRRRYCRVAERMMMPLRSSLVTFGRSLLSRRKPTG